VVVRGGKRDVLTARGWRGDSGASKLDANGTGAGGGIVGGVGIGVEPDKVGDPVCVGVARDLVFVSTH
jgi:hypothetical protein